MNINPLKDFLKQLGLLESVFFRNKEDGNVFSGFNSELWNKLEIIRPDAYYIFNNQPLILFFDLTAISNPEREKEIHKQVWSFDNSPVIFILKASEIKVYNALNYDKKSGSLEEIVLSKEEREEKFSFWNLQSGFTWKWLQTEYLEKGIRKKYRKRVNERLFQNIKEVREELTTKSNTNCLSDNEANLLILRLIFIRYLIDREVKIDDNYVSGKTRNDKRKSFASLIQKPEKLSELFDILNGKFNGVLFKEINISLTQTQAYFLAGVFKGEIQEKGSLFEDYYFEIFDFSIIPVEVISGIYESLIDEEKRKKESAVYTPPFLVEYILEDTVQRYLDDNTTSECKIFEVAVGSGIFLVQSLRKMIDKEIALHGIQDKKAFSNRIREIAKNNLFGIDVNPEALKVACFSIYIALLDYQEPKDIDKYPFPNLLNENLFEANFFDVAHRFNDKIINEKPIFILGNPPWGNGSKDKLHVNYLKENNLIRVVSDYQLAQSFILRTKDFSISQPVCSLIITSKAIYNSNAISFKKYFLEAFYLRKCLDLSSVRRLIFEKANNPAMILQYQYANKEITFQNPVIHESLKYNIFIKYFNLLILEKNDSKTIKQEFFYKYEWLFKVALYGGTIDFDLLSKLKGATINDFLKKNKIPNGNGIKKGSPKKYFDFLIGMPIINTSEITKYYSHLSTSPHFLKKEDVFLEAGRKESLFRGEKILLGKRTKEETEINVSFIKDDCVFKDSVNSITFSKEKDSDKHLLFSIFISDLYIYYQYLTSSSWGIYYPEIHKNEYLSFPFVEPDEKTKEKLITLVNDFLAPFQEYYRQEMPFGGPPEGDKNALNKINTIINELYAIKEYERDLINYVLDVSRYQFQASKQDQITDFTSLESNHYRNRALVLKKYAEVYLNEFKKIYEDEFMQVEIYPLGYFIAMNFVFYDKKPSERIIYPKNKTTEKEVLERLANNLRISQITNTTDPTQNLFIQKDIKGFEENSFYIIKPNEYKCWHRAIAWYDVAEFKEAIEDAELNRLKKSVYDF